MLSTGAGSAVSKGTAFERLSLELLQKYFSMTLNRVGGASDGGIDLQGWWWLPSKPNHAETSTHSSGPSTPSSSAREDPRRRLRVLAQCKANARKLGPSVVREMEGVVYQHWIADEDLPNRRDVGLHSSPSHKLREELVALIISQSPFTKQSVLRSMSSSVPFLLMHLPEASRTSDPSAALELPNNISVEDSSVGSVIWNAALASRDGLLHGEYEVRWTRTTENKSCERVVGAGQFPERERALGSAVRPVLWWNGSPLGNWAPAGSSSHQTMSG